jgi:hypothetical protein
VTREPLTLTYDRIVKVLRDQELKVISWNSSRDPEPDTREETDFPELQVRPTATQVNLGNKSCGTEVIQTYTILMATGDDRLGYLLFPTGWRLLQALWLMKYTDVLEGLLYNEHEFVHNCEVVSVTADLDLSAARGIEGWDALWDINVQMNLPDSDLNPNAVEEEALS